METNYKDTTPNRYTEKRPKQTDKMTPGETQNRQRKDDKTLNTRETSQKETSPHETSPPGNAKKWHIYGNNNDGRSRDS